MHRFNCQYFLSSFLTPIQFGYVSLFVLVVFMVVYLRAYKISKLSILGTLLLLAGGISNSFERMKTGCVTDNINFFGLFYYNVFDLLIDAGLFLVILNIWSIWKKKELNQN